MRKSFIIGMLACALGVARLGPAAAGEMAQELKAGQLTRAGDLSAKLSANPDAEDISARCGLLLLENNARAASTCFQEELISTPDSKIVLTGLAEARRRLDDFAGAAEAYEKAGKMTKAAQSELLAKSSPYRVGGRRVTFVAPFAKTDPLPVLMVRLSDHRLHPFLLDTGAGQTILDPQLATALHLQPVTGTTSGVFAGGQTAAVGYGVLPFFGLGNLEITNIPVQLLSTAGFASALDGAKVEGVIGVDLLRRFRATIDYPRHRLVLNSTESPQATKGAIVRIWLAGDHFILAEAKIDGAPELALLDTGLAGKGCTLPASTFTAIHQVASGPAMPGVGGGGTTSAVEFAANSIELGPTVRRDVPCLFGPFPPTLETSTGARIGLLISHAYLRSFAVTFDFQNMQMSLVPGR